MRNDFYDIAYEDLLYLQATLHLPFYNNIAVASEQIAEKMLKSVVERINVDCESLLRSHNLRALFDTIRNEYPSCHIDRGKLSMLKDYYFDAKYPGDNFVNVTKEECIDTMYSVINYVHYVRKQMGLECYNITQKPLTNHESEG